MKARPTPIAQAATAVRMAARLWYCRYWGEPRFKKGNHESGGKCPWRIFTSAKRTISSWTAESLRYGTCTSSGRKMTKETAQVPTTKARGTSRPAWLVSAPAFTCRD